MMKNSSFFKNGNKFGIIIVCLFVIINLGASFLLLSQFKRNAASAISIFYEQNTAIIKSADTFAISSSLNNLLGTMNQNYCISATKKNIGFYHHEGQYCNQLRLGNQLEIDSRKEGGIIIYFKVAPNSEEKSSFLILILLVNLFGGLVAYIVYLSFKVSTQKKFIEFTKYQAIAQTSQILAHDVRQPFSMIRGFLDILRGIDRIEEVKESIEKFGPHIEKSLASVNNMISDIMEVGTNTPPIREFYDPETLIQDAVKEFFQFKQHLKTNLHFDFRHSRSINIAPLKVRRAIMNIIGNATQAMKNKGEIWFKTSDKTQSGKNFVEISIRNSGSTIPKEDIGNLFEAFFTKGKKAGTGLGLAIVKKIVVSHGGKIYCNSTPETGVEFIFTLPVFEE